MEIPGHKSESGIADCRVVAAYVLPTHTCRALSKNFVGGTEFGSNTLVKHSTQSVVAPVEIPGEIEPRNGFDIEDSSRLEQSPEWFWLLWPNRRFLGRILLWGVVISSIVAFLIPSRYESTTRLMPPESQSSSGMAMMAAMAGLGGGSGSGGGGGGGAGLGALAGDLLGLKSSGALFIDILSGPTVQDRIIDRFDLRKVYRDKYWVDARSSLAKHTSISEDRKSGVISITVTDGNPSLAAQIAQAYVEELNRIVAQVSTSSARRERMFIEERLVTVKRDLGSSSKEFSEYASKNTAIDITVQGKAMLEAAARLEGERIAAQSELQGLEQIYSNNNVRVRALRARIGELQKQLDKFGGLDVNDEASNPDAEPQFPTIRQLPLLAVRWADLYRQTKTQEKVFELLTQQYELAKIQEAKEIPVVSVLDAAKIAEKRSFPPRGLMIINGGVLALGGAIAWLLGSAFWNRIDPRDPRKVLALSVATDLAMHLPWGKHNGSGVAHNTAEKTE
jgi:capsule polysaccharide export protein KpsE/RkpR